jgi:hypothetical protein
LGTNTSRALHYPGAAPHGIGRIEAIRAMLDGTGDGGCKISEKLWNKRIIERVTGAV